jgi:hypothetical protein
MIALIDLIRSALKRKKKEGRTPEQDAAFFGARCFITNMGIVAEPTDKNPLRVVVAFRGIRWNWHGPAPFAVYLMRKYPGLLLEDAMSIAEMIHGRVTRVRFPDGECVA